MKLFLDSSVLLAGAGSDRGASRFLITKATASEWQLISSSYCVAEVVRNIGKLGSEATLAWENLIRPCFSMAHDCWSLDRPLLMLKSKDRPVIITALAEKCDILLTLDRADFETFFERGVYGMRVMTPGAFLVEGDEGGKLKS